MKNLFFSNIELKILSLIIALTLWFVVRGEQRAEVFLQVKVELKNTPNYLIVTSQNADKIKIRVNGPKALISKIDEKYFKPFECDLTGASAGEQSFRIIPSIFKVEKGLEVLDLAPKEIKVTLEMIVKKELPIEPSFSEKLLHGYELEGYDIYPESIKVMGPQSQLYEVTVVKTAPIDLVGKKRSFVEKYPLILPGKNLWVEGETELVLVNVKIKEGQITRIIKDVPVRPKSEGSSWKLETKFINIKAVGPASKVDDLKREDIDAVADVLAQDLARIPKGEKIEGKLLIKEISGLSLSGLNPVYVIKLGAR